MDFHDEDILARLDSLSHEEMDALPFGCVAMSLDGTVTIYNARESEMAGISKDRVVGLNFFEDVAPCTNNYLVAGRYEEPDLDETIDYVFTLRMKPSRVTLRLLKSAAAEHQFMLVKR